MNFVEREDCLKEIRAYVSGLGVYSSGRTYHAEYDEAAAKDLLVELERIIRASVGVGA